MALDHDHCFLCGVELTDAIRTDEHVFPKWMQRDFDLWNEELNLLNANHNRKSYSGGRGASCVSVHLLQ